MPLSATTLPGKTDEHRRGIEFWMTDSEGRRVRVIASYVALHELGLHSRPRTTHEAFSVFNAHRGEIEAVAGRLFDANRMTVDIYGGPPFIIVRSLDLDFGG